MHSARNDAFSRYRQDGAWFFLTIGLAAIAGALMLIVR
jgi:hypothetical protein